MRPASCVTRGVHQHAARKQLDHARSAPQPDRRSSTNNNTAFSTAAVTTTTTTTTTTTMAGPLRTLLLGCVCTIAAVATAAAAPASSPLHLHGSRGDTSAAFLGVNGTSLVFRGREVFLSGANQPWVSYGADFGNNQSNGVRCALQESIRNVSAAGGNSIRMWLFVEGEAIPAFDGSGMCVGTDGTHTLTADLRQYARYAASQNVFITLCLWNGAVLKSSDPARGLVTDPDKLQSFVDKALTPLVTDLAGEPGIGAWEVMNEPEGSVAIAGDDEPCFDTKTVLQGSGAGWSGANLAMKDLLRFHNVQAAAIHAADPKALVTVGSWSQYASSDAPLGTVDPGRSFFNYYKDECLVKAGGHASGTLDFYQIHTYPGGTDHDFSPSSPLRVAAGALQLDRPVVIGEFAAKPCQVQGCDVQSLYKRAADTNYSGVWDWSLLAGDSMDDEADAVLGIAAIASDPRVAVDIKSGSPPPGPDTCSCSDVAPDSSYTCAQQAGWGKCDMPFMKGFCCRSCHACSGCS